MPLWWISNLCRHLIDDLWQHSLHQNLPTEPPAGTEEKYPDLRRLFISSLYARKTSEVELWPSQREAAQRSTDVTDDLVVALPTSAGKTRVAEIAALMTLSSARRVLIVTPLQKIHVIEPYVAAVGFVDNPTSMFSRLQTLTIEEYRARRAAHALASVANTQPAA